jgi:hypothetical protein
MKYHLALIVLFLLSSGCTSRTKVIARDVDLGTQPVQAEMENPWPFKSSALQICIEPTSAYTRRPIGLQFQDADGIPIRPFAVLKSRSGKERVLDLSRMYVDQNLACFSVHEDMAKTYDTVDLRADRPIRVERAYWYWFFFH